MRHKAFSLVALAATLTAVPALSAQTPADPPSSTDPAAAVVCAVPKGGDGHTAMDHAAPAENEFTALQRRGRLAMGVDQYTSTHRFDILPDGGRIELQRDVDDPEGIETIREHLRGIAESFARGDFCTPAFVHDRSVPGTAVLAARKDAITYTFGALPRGGEIRIRTTDPVALEAIRAFMQFQRSDHRQGGQGH